MVDHVEKLIDVLAKLETQYRQLLSVMITEKQATLSSNAEMMNSVVLRKQELMASLSRLEQQRRGLLQQIAGRFRIPVSDLTIDTIAKLTNNNSSVKIKHLGNTLAKLLPKVQQSNDENRALIQHCLSLVQNTLGFFQHWLAPGSVYGSKGRVNDGSLSGKLLSGTV